MRISVTVKPNAKRTAVEPQPDGSLKVSVQAPAQEGRANEAVLAALAEHLGVPRSRLRITHGLKGKRKLVEIDE